MSTQIPKIPATMTGVQLTGHGGLEMLAYRTDIPTPVPKADEVLIQVAAAGVNNTDINTRIGWYNSDVKEATSADSTVESGKSGGWTDGLVFPRVQGADCVGRIVAVGAEVSDDRLGERVVCDPYIKDPSDKTGLDSAGFLGSEHEGAFAQFIAVPSRNVLTVPAAVALSDEELACLPCSGGTAMNMLLMAGAGKGDLALVTGASGGVGTFLVQILKHLGAEVVAVSSAAKKEAVLAVGADHWVDRNLGLEAAVMEATGGRQLSLVADVVGGDTFTQMLAVLRRGGRYVTAGAIAGPIVPFDLRTLYLKSLSFFGSSIYRADTIQTLVDAVAEGGFTPVVESVHPLAEIGAVQTKFLEKKHVGTFILKPPAVQ